MIHPPEHRSPSSRKGRIHKLERQLCSQMLYRDFEPARESILMEPVFGPSARIAYAPCVLYAWQEFLRAYSSCIVQWMMICPTSLCRLGRMKGIKSHKDHTIEGGNVLKKVHPVGQANGRSSFGRWGSSDIIPGGPGNVPFWHELWYVSIPLRGAGDFGTYRAI